MTLFIAVGLTVCLLAAVTDFRSGRIPNWLTYPVLVLSPPTHLALALGRGMKLEAALGQAGFSLLGLVACGFVPLLLWRKGAMGGGDVKLFAALGALTLPRFGFEARLYVLVVASVLAPLKLIYRGHMLRTLSNLFEQLGNVFRKREQRKPLDPELVAWFRLGPCFAVGFALQTLLHWRAP